MGDVSRDGFVVRLRRVRRNTSPPWSNLIADIRTADRVGESDKPTYRATSLALQGMKALEIGVLL